jgi:uncharacterized C2H2 Zn-finger protein
MPAEPSGEEPPSLRPTLKCPNCGQIFEGDKRRHGYRTHLSRAEKCRRAVQRLVKEQSRGSR